MVAVEGHARFLLLALVPAALDAPDVRPLSGRRLVHAEEVVCGGDPLVDVALEHVQGTTPAVMMRRRPLEPVPRWKDSSLSMGPMLAAKGLNAEVESMPSWNLPSRSTNIV